MVGLSSKGEILVLASIDTGAYVSLHTSDPGDMGANEITGDPAYARQGAVIFANTGANPTVASNTAIITFPVATAIWGTVTHFGVWDAATAGNFRGSGAVATPKAVGAGDTARFSAGALTITAQ